MPIFKSFVKKTVRKDNARPFKIPKGIKMLVVNSNTGERASYNDQSIIIEAFKEKDLVNNKIQYGNVNYISKENIYNFY
jgi:penicillin-binding protein 1A